MGLLLWTLAIAIVTASSCALCGALLVVKRESMVSEGLSHGCLAGDHHCFFDLGRSQFTILDRRRWTVGITHGRSCQCATTHSFGRP